MEKEGSKKKRVENLVGKDRIWIFRNCWGSRLGFKVGVQGWGSRLGFKVGVQGWGSRLGFKVGVQKRFLNFD
jgi:hypothetical protein